MYANFMMLDKRRLTLNTKVKHIDALAEILQPYTACRFAIAGWKQDNAAFYIRWQTENYNCRNFWNIRYSNMYNLDL